MEAPGDFGVFPFACKFLQLNVNFLAMLITSATVIALLQLSANKKVNGG